MAHYKRITKRKETKHDLLEDPTDRLQEWFEDNYRQIFIAVGVALLAVATYYGVSYYKIASFERAQTRLYEAQAVARQDAATQDQAQRAVAMLEDVASGGQAQVRAQAMLDEASLLMRMGRFDEAAAKYAAVAGETEPGSLYNELAAAGQVSALVRGGREKEAVKGLENLSSGAIYYPREEARLTLAYVYAVTGSADKAVKALEELKTSGESAYYSSEYLDGVIAAVKNGDLEKVYAKYKEVAADAPKAHTGAGLDVPGAGAPVGQGDVH